MPPEPEIRLQRSTLRAWREADVAALARHANDREVSRNLRDSFPHPYTQEHARAWIARARAHSPLCYFAIEVDGEAVGGIGVTPLADVYRRSGEIAYWLARPLWRRGIVSEAVPASSEYAFTTLDLARLQCGVLAWNTGSLSLLEKCGYEREGVQRRGAFKDGEFVDVVLFARLRPEA